MKNIFNLLFAVLFALSLINPLCSFAASTNINSYKILTESYPPYNYQEEGDLKGISVEILDKILEKIKADLSKNDVELLSWARAYNITLRKSDTMFFSTTRTDQRENLFKWVGPITKTEIALVTNKDITINKISDLKNYKIGVVRNDIGESLLYTNGVSRKNISAVDSLEQNIRKLDTKRIDLIAYESNVIFWKLKRMEYRVDDFKKVYKLSEGDLYYAFNKNTPESIIEKFQKALEELKEDGTVNKILSKY